MYTFHRDNSQFLKLSTCFDIQKTLNSCVTGSENYKKLSPVVREIVNHSTSQSFITNYVSYQNRSLYPFVSMPLYNTKNKIWKGENNEALNAIHEECNFLSLHECMKGLYEQ